MSQDTYALGRDYVAATRLNLQHFLWKQTLGFCLHPGIPADKENLQVADVGTGTGSWLFDVAQQMPASCQFTGFDVSDAQFTQKEWLPSNMSFELLDATIEPPQHLHEKFDIVHLRLFLAVVNNDDPTPVLQHCLTLLKPGGYLQWDENDPDLTDVVSVHDPDSAPNFRGFRETIKSFKPMKWVASLSKAFESHGLQNVTVHTSREHVWQRRMYNEMQCILGEEYVATMLTRLGPAAVGDKKLLAQKMCEEVKNGSGWTTVQQVIVGQKQMRKS